MSPCKSCPIESQCEKELEQIVYCRHVEMLKKIGQMRSKRQQAAALNIHTQPLSLDHIQVDCRTQSEPPLSRPRIDTSNHN